MLEKSILEKVMVFENHLQNGLRLKSLMSKIPILKKVFVILCSLFIFCHLHAQSKLGNAVNDFIKGYNESKERYERNEVERRVEQEKNRRIDEKWDAYSQEQERREKLEADMIEWASEAERKEIIKMQKEGNQIQGYYNASNTGNIESVWYEHNIYLEEGYGGKKIYGMNIHVKFYVNGMQNKKCNCVAWFSNSNGGILYSENYGYATTSNTLCCSKNFSPIYEKTYYQDLVLSIPYYTFYIDRGRSYRLRFLVGLFDDNNKPFSNSEFTYFDINIGSQ